MGGERARSVLDPTVRVHPSAILDSTDVGAHTRIWAFVRLQPRCRVGDDCQICDHASIGVEAWLGDRVTIKEYAAIGQGTIVEDDAFLGPFVVTPNDNTPRSPRMLVPEVRERYANTENWLEHTRIGRGASIGTGAIIAPGRTVGAFAMVAIGAIVNRDVPPHRLVAGSPARAVGWVCFCGANLVREGEGSQRLDCPRCAHGFREADGGLTALDPPEATGASTDPRRNGRAGDTASEAPPSTPASD